MTIKRHEKVMPFSGGVISDTDATTAQWIDQENLLPAFQGGPGLKPRAGIESIASLSTLRTSGCVVFLVTLDDNTQTKLVVFLNASTDQIIYIGEYSEQFGRKAQEPWEGGRDPDDPGGPIWPVLNVCKSFMKFGSGPVSGTAGQTINLPLVGVGIQYGAVGAYAFILNASGQIASADFEDATAAGGYVLPTGLGTVLQGDLPVQSKTSAGGKTFTAYLWNPEQGTLENPTKLEFTVNHPARGIIAYRATAASVAIAVQVYNGGTILGRLLTAPSGWSSSTGFLVRLSDDVVGAVNNALSGNPLTLSLYSLDSIVAANSATAVAPYATATMTTLATLGLESIYTSSSGKCYALGSVPGLGSAGSSDEGEIVEIDLATGSVSAPVAITLGSALHYNTAASHRVSCLTTDGYVHIGVTDGGANLHYVAKINKATGGIYSRTTGATEHKPTSILPNGALLWCYEDGTVGNYYSMDGAAGTATTTVGLATANAAEGVNKDSDGASRHCNSDGKFLDADSGTLYLVTNGISRVSVGSVGDIPTGHSWLSSSQAYHLYQSGTSLLLKLYDSDGNAAGVVTVDNGDANTIYDPINSGTATSDCRIVPDAFFIAGALAGSA